MTTITIEMDETGAGQFSVDGSEPTPFQSAEEVCQVIEAMAGATEGTPEQEGEAMQAGFNQARGSQAGMLGA